MKNEIPVSRSVLMARCQSINHKLGISGERANKRDKLIRVLMEEGFYDHLGLERFQNSSPG